MKYHSCFSPSFFSFWQLCVNTPGNPVSEGGAANRVVGAWAPRLPLGRHVTRFGLHVELKNFWNLNSHWKQAGTTLKDSESAMITQNTTTSVLNVSFLSVLLTVTPAPFRHFPALLKQSAPFCLTRVCFGQVRLILAYSLPVLCRFKSETLSPEWDSSSFLS